MVTLLCNVNIMMKCVNAFRCHNMIQFLIWTKNLFRAENYWWRGQNRQTLKVGQFPRNVVTSVAGLSAHDISRPLKHSFIHTGHGDTDPHRSWGTPDKIDEWEVQTEASSFRAVECYTMFCLSPPEGSTALFIFQVFIYFIYFLFIYKS